MKLLRPIAITEGMLISSTVAEDDYAAWSGGTTYAAADRCIKGHVIWESLQGSNTNHDPETDASDPPYWLRVSSTNRWRMFDQTVNSQTSATSQILVELQPGAINAVGLVELQGSTATVQVFDGTAEVYSRTQDIDATVIEDWYDYFFEPFDYASALLFSDVPTYLTGTVVITIVGGGTVACGGVSVGALYDLGQTSGGATAGITDYSRKTTNTFGVTEIVERAFSKRASLQLNMETAQIRRVQALLASVRAAPCMWIGDDDTLTFAPLVIYGFFRDFQIEIPGPVISYCSLELEGMI